ncbi:hypothetical protein SAMN05444411_1261 [Lutibacter oricola]|uniref:Uncharacterized protein n=1 Tax=Lutibacter oricola TaxID=762486 RepID=A0A1H3H719_9FLAO|nr:hypothetical protein [Lutibacter oricola]SDY10564.1 hypothetical protein SAMN05444411_1261 [Lutibacter oricola]
MNDLDKILFFLTEHKNSKRRVFMPSVKSIQKDLFPYYNVDQIISLLNQIQQNRPDILKYKRTSAGDLIQISGLAESFLSQGGFTEIEEKQTRELQKKNERENIEFEKTKVDLELARKMLKEYPKTKLIARISIIIGIGLAVLEIIRALGLLDSNN